MSQYNSHSSGDNPTNIEVEIEEKSETENTCNSVHNYETLLLEVKQSNLKIFDAINSLQNSLRDRSSSSARSTPMKVDHLSERSESGLEVTTLFSVQNHGDHSDQMKVVEEEEGVLENGKSVLTPTTETGHSPDPDPNSSDTLKSDGGENSSEASSVESAGDERREIKIVKLGDVHHRWVKRWISRPTKCLACMGDLPMYCHSAECYICKVTIHHQCAENLQNTCGQAMLTSDEYIDQEVSMLFKLGLLHMCGWVKAWRPKERMWKCVWACIQERCISLFTTNDSSTVPIDQLEIRNALVQLYNPSSGDENDSCNVPFGDRPFYACVFNDSKKMHLICPDLIAKQKWLGAVRKSSIL